MSDHIWDSDEELLAELGEALRSAGSTTASHLAARAAWALRERSHVEIARLTFDSMLADTGSLRDMQNATARMLTFGTEDGVSLEVELTGDRLLGQVFPVLNGTITSVVMSGPEQRVDTDELGCFSLPLPSGPFRLRFESTDTAFLTDWMRL